MQLQGSETKNFQRDTAVHCRFIQKRKDDPNTGSPLWGGGIVFFIKYVTDLRFFSFSHLCEKWHTFVEGLFYRQSQTQNLWYILYTFLVEGFRILKADWLSRFLSILLTQHIELFGAVCSHWTGKVFVCFFNPTIKLSKEWVNEIIWHGCRQACGCPSARQIATSCESRRFLAMFI